jgi:hypothetical protein
MHSSECQPLALFLIYVAYITLPLPFLRGGIASSAEASVGPKARPQKPKQVI